LLSALAVAAAAPIGVNAVLNQHSIEASFSVGAIEAIKSGDEEPQTRF
jgi:hypothetical protein